MHSRHSQAEENDDDGMDAANAKPFYVFLFLCFILVFFFFVCVVFWLLSFGALFHFHRRRSSTFMSSLCFLRFVLPSNYC